MRLAVRRKKRTWFVDFVIPSLPTCLACYFTYRCFVGIETMGLRTVCETKNERSAQAICPSIRCLESRIEPQCSQR